MDARLVGSVLLALSVGSEARADLGEADAIVARSAPGVRLRNLVIRGPRARIGLEIPSHQPLSPVPTDVENAFEELVGWLESSAPEVTVIDLLLAHPGAALQPPRAPSPPPRPELPAVPADRPAFAFPAALRSVRPPPDRIPHGQALAGRTIAVSPGHGYIFYASLGRYATQRANIKWPGCGSCRGLVEDFGTHALVVRHLVPLLEGAGARVVLLRERSENVGVDLVDDGSAAYLEAGRFQDGSSPGGHEGSYRAGFGPDAVAQWSLRAPGGPAWLSTWYVSGTNRPSDALLDILLPAGRRVELRLDQTDSGRRWVPLWPIDAPAGTPIEVRLSLPAAAAADTALIADALRLGAGRHESGHPWFQMGALPFAQLQSAPADITSRVDVGVRPSYAEWLGADAFVSIHSNATGRDNSTTSGTVTYRYSCQAVSDHAPDPDPSVCDDPTGSDELQTEIHRALVARLRADWDPAWSDRGPKAANFGELRLLETLPGVLVETAFHDNTVAPSGGRMTDNQALQDPRWRRAAAWGIYEGLTRFLAGPAAPLLAPAPTWMAAQRLGPGRVQLDFEPVPGALEYQVEWAIDGLNYEPGPRITSIPARIDVPEDVPVGLRIRSLNAAGIGVPSRSVAVRAGPEPSPLLLVDGFERLDAWVQTPDNRGDTAILHGLALEPSGVSFDGAQEAALAGGQIRLEGYSAAVFALGRESTEHQVLSPELRTQLRSYVEGGGFLFLAGTEIGWAWEARGDAESRRFLQEVLGARYRADDAQSRSVRGVGPLAAVFGTAPQPLAGDGEGRAAVAYPDVFTTEPGFSAGLEYGDGTAAAVAGDRTLVVGFAIDHLLRAEDRAALLGGWASLAVGSIAPPVRDAGSGLDVFVPAPDAASASDASPDLSFDAGVSAAPDLGEGSPTSGDLLTPAGPGRAPIEGACGCREVRGRRPGDALGGWALVAMALWMRVRARRRNADRKSDAEAAV